MTEEINNYLILIESTIINTHSPDYIEVSFQNGFIYVIVCKEEYKDIMLHERIQEIFALLEFEHDDIFDKHQVIVECLNLKELNELFKLYEKKYE